MNTKKLSLLILMIGILVVTAFASDKNEISPDREYRWNENRQFFKEHIKPKVDEQRNKLEPSISGEDKKEINRIREEIISQMLMQNDLFHEARALRIKGEEVDDGLMQELQAQRIVIENLHDEAKLIANKYRPEIDDLVSDLRGELRSEREDFRSQSPQAGKGNGRYRQGPCRDGHGNGPQSFGKRPGGNREGRNNLEGMGPNRHRFMDVTGFLLWDVNWN